MYSVAILFITSFCMLRADPRINHKHPPEVFVRRLVQNVNITMDTAKKVLGRGLILNDQLIHEIKAIVESPPSPADRSYTSSGFHNMIEHATIFCCDCKNLQLNCPICYHDNHFHCEYPFRDFSRKQQIWFRTIFYPEYSRSASILQYDYPYTINTNAYVPWYKNNNGFYLFENIYRDCKYPSYMLNHRYYVGGCSQCSTIVKMGEECPSKGVSECVWKATTALPLNIGHKLCYTYQHQPCKYLKSVTSLCSINGKMIVIPELYDYLNYHATDPVPPEYVPVPIAIVNETYLFRVKDDTRLNQMVKILSEKNINHAYTRESFMMRIGCYSEGTLGNNIFNGKASWLGDLLFQPTCNEYVPFNTTHDICKYFLTSDNFYCSSEVFKARNPLTFSFGVPYYLNDTSSKEESDHQEGGNRTESICAGVSDFAKCVLMGLINETMERFDGIISKYNANISSDAKEFINEIRAIANATQYNHSVYISERLNSSLYFSVKAFVDLLGRNETPPQFLNLYSTREGSRLVGNWFTGIFGALIEPFFDALISIVIENIFPPIIKAIAAVITVLAELLKDVIDGIEKVLTQLGNAISDLVGALLKLIIGIIIYLETKLLLLEYAILFVTLVYYFGYSNICAIIIMTVIIIVFGIQRKSPSFLLFFVNQDFAYVNLDSYRSTNFSYDYNLYMYSYKQTHSQSLNPHS